MLPGLSLLLLAVLAVTHPKLAVGLSFSVCDEVGEEFITDGPRLEGQWPYYSLLYTCSGNLNLEGFAVDACVSNGSNCGQAAADAFCRYLGFDYNSPSLFTTKTATAPAISMTGEWCLSPGQYSQLGHPNKTQFESILAANTGPYCGVLDSVTCVRHRNSIRSELGAILAPTAAPPSAAGSPQSGRTASVLANPVTVSAGRKMMTALPLAR